MRIDGRRSSLRGGRPRPLRATRSVVRRSRPWRSRAPPRGEAEREFSVSRTMDCSVCGRRVRERERGRNRCWRCRVPLSVAPSSSAVALPSSSVAPPSSKAQLCDPSTYLPFDSTNDNRSRLSLSLSLSLSARHSGRSKQQKNSSLFLHPHRPLSLSLSLSLSHSDSW